MSSMDLPRTMAVTGRLRANDVFFEGGDTVCIMYKRLGVFDVDSEELCHKEIQNLICEIPGCGVKLASVMELELHYNSNHRYTCATCRKSFASAHLLDLHIEETHDSFFAVQAERKPMYQCLVENCTERFTSSQERHNHCVDSHAFPPNFRWVTPKVSKSSKSIKSKSHAPKSKEKKLSDQDTASDMVLQMEVDTVKEENKRDDGKKIFRGFYHGRGNFKKSFTSSEWHRRENKTTTASPLEGSQLHKDLMDSLQTEEMS